MPNFSEHFGLARTQAELDFVDVPIDGDIRLFIDPFALSQRVDAFSARAHKTLVEFFQRVVDAIRVGNLQMAETLVLQFKEPNETRLGMSRRRPRGAGMAEHQARLLLNALAESSAIKTGIISSLEECELMIDGIGHDKISDLTTTVIREHLADYTSTQCDLWNVPTQRLPLPPSYSTESGGWVSRYYDLPLAGELPVLLVPKAIVRWSPAVNHQNYYRHFVLNFLQTESVDANSSLARTLRNGRVVVYKKDVEAAYPCSKKFLFEFSKQHPAVLSQYREELRRLGPDQK